MNDPSAALQHVGAALNSGDRNAVMACFADDATLTVTSGQERIAFTGKGIREAVDALMSGFDDIKLTPISRQVTESRVVEESVLSGKHTGSFAGAQPTNGRVRVNVKLSATAATDSTLRSLWLEADTRALFAQIAGTDDAVGATGVLVATARERHDGAVRVVDGVRKPSAPEGAALIKARSLRLLAAIGAAAVVLLVVAFAWRPGAGDAAIDAAANHPAIPTTGMSKPTATSTPTQKPTASPTKPAALPVIATPPPKAVPRVQAGEQLVLKSDVLFALNSAALTPAARTALTRLAGQIRAAAVTGTIQVNGYTDNLGGVGPNLVLSRARALAVAQALQAGLAGRPITLAPQGFGQANPVAPNTTDASRTRNRRVTIVLPKPR